MKQTNRRSTSIWQVAKRTEDDIIKQILVNRQLTDPMEQQRFLHPDFERDFVNPFLLRGVKKAVNRLKQAKERQETIGIFGDYDADGIPATALMIRGLSYLGFKDPVSLIPTREESYGLSQEKVDFFLKHGCSLLITLDNGITSRESVEYAKKRGIDTIVVDHHEIQPNLLPRAVAVVDPKQSSCHYPEKTLCACALTFKLVWALALGLKKETNQLKWLLDLVAISTVADLVPLLGENRLLVKFGLIVLNKTRNLGLRALCQKAKLEMGKIDSYHAGFVIAPRLNAPSRVNQEKDDQAGTNTILRLLTTDDRKEAVRLADIVDQINAERQKRLEEATQEAVKLAEIQVGQKRRVIVLANKRWPTGIVGLVASKLVEVYNRPAFVFGQIGSNLVGSARSVKKFDLMASLEKLASLFVRFGGHKMAAGLSLEPEKFKWFVDEIEKLASRILTEEDLVKKIKVDLQVRLEEINLPLVKKLESLAPFGFGNPRPTFLVSGKVSDVRLMGKDQNHLSFFIEEDSRRFKVVAFNCSDLHYKIKLGQAVDVVVDPRVDSWQGRESVKLFLLDL